MAPSLLKHMYAADHVRSDCLGSGDSHEGGRVRAFRLQRVKRRVQRKLSLYMERRTARVNVPEPMVSFTFDDVYASACVNGSAVLTERGQRGTFYVAMGMCDTTLAGLRCFSEQHLREVYAAAHEVGGHTFSHLRYDGDQQAYLDDIERNVDAIRDVLQGWRPRSFSFPYGQIQPGVKAGLDAHYQSLRSIEPGLNAGRVDLNMLRSYALYNSILNESRVDALLKRAVRRRGWLIFYAHDVSPSPSHMGCTPKLLSHAVDCALNAGCRVLPVADAVEAITTQQRFEPPAAC